jgi:hypothetical protein
MIHRHALIEDADWLQLDSATGDEIAGSRHDGAGSSAIFGKSAYLAGIHCSTPPALAGMPVNCSSRFGVPKPLPATNPKEYYRQGSPRLSQ